MGAQSGLGAGAAVRRPFRSVSAIREDPFQPAHGGCRGQRRLEPRRCEGAADCGCESHDCHVTCSSINILTPPLPGSIPQIPLKHWVIVVTKRDRSKAVDFLDMMRRVTPPMGIEVATLSVNLEKVNILVNAEHYGASVREVADGTKNADSAGLNRFPIRPATFARSAAHAQ